MIVGAHRLAFHARPRYTGGLDILIRATTENAVKFVDLLNQFGFAGFGFNESVGRPQDLADLELPEN